MCIFVPFGNPFGNVYTSAFQAAVRIQFAVLLDKFPVIPLVPPAQDAAESSVWRLGLSSASRG